MKTARYRRTPCNRHMLLDHILRHGWSVIRGEKYNRPLKKSSTLYARSVYYVVSGPG